MFFSDNGAGNKAAGGAAGGAASGAADGDTAGNCRTWEGGCGVVMAETEGYVPPPVVMDAGGGWTELGMAEPRPGRVAGSCGSTGSSGRPVGGACLLPVLHR